MKTHIKRLTCRLRVYSPPLEEEVDATLNKMPRSLLCAKRKRDSAQHQIMERTGWSLTNHVAECVPVPQLVSDHPVCGASVASRLFIEAAATPPHEEGNTPTRTCRPIYPRLLTELP